MKTIKTDVCVIGGSSGGLSFAAGAEVQRCSANGGKSESDFY